VTLLERSGLVRSGIKTVVFGTVVTYAIALVASAAILWFFGRFDGISPITCPAQTVVLGTRRHVALLPVGFTATAMKTWKRIG